MEGIKSDLKQKGVAPSKAELLSTAMLALLSISGKFTAPIPGLGQQDVTVGMVRVLDEATIKLLVHHVKKNERAWAALESAAESALASHAGSAAAWPLTSAATPVRQAPSSSPASSDPAGQTASPQKSASPPAAPSPVQEQGGAAGMPAEQKAAAESAPDAAPVPAPTAAVTAVEPIFHEPEPKAEVSEPAALPAPAPEPVQVVHQEQPQQQQPTYKLSLPVGKAGSHEGSKVEVAGSWDGWQTRVPLHYNSSSGHFEGSLPDATAAAGGHSKGSGGSYAYKYIIDNDWRCREDQPTVRDEHGNANHQLVA